MSIDVYAVRHNERFIPWYEKWQKEFHDANNKGSIEAINALTERRFRERPALGGVSDKHFKDLSFCPFSAVDTRYEAGAVHDLLGAVAYYDDYVPPEEIKKALENLKVHPPTDEHQIRMLPWLQRCGELGLGVEFSI